MSSTRPSAASSTRGCRPARPAPSSTPTSSRSPSAQRALPTPSRPRDFHLTPAEARRLRPGGFRAVLAAIGSTRDAFSKPLAVGLTTLGLVGLLVGTMPSFGSPASGPEVLSTVGDSVGADTTDGDGTVFGGQDANPSAAPRPPPRRRRPRSAAASADIAAEPEGASAAPETCPRVRDVAGAAVSAAPSLESAALRASDESEKAPGLGVGGTGPSPLLIVSLVMLASGSASSSPAGPRAAFAPPESGPLAGGPPARSRVHWDLVPHRPVLYQIEACRWIA